MNGTVVWTLAQVSSRLFGGQPGRKQGCAP